MPDILVRSEMVARVARVAAQVGARVVEGDEIIVLEAMKMELPVLAPASGVVSTVLVAEGDMVGEGQTLAKLAR
jgi:biotin carboxyl carrier protein